MLHISYSQNKPKETCNNIVRISYNIAILAHFPNPNNAHNTIGSFVGDDTFLPYYYRASCRA